MLLDRGVLPEVVTLVLHPKGQFRLSGQLQWTSRRGKTRLGVTWTVIEMWTLSAEDLLALGDVGVVPWVPLARTALPPEELLRRCRDQIDQQARPEEHDNLLAVTQVMTVLRYNDGGLLTLLGGRPMPWLSEIPYIQQYAKELAEERAKELAEERARELNRDTLQATVLELLRAKFTEVPDEVSERIRAIQDTRQLEQLIVRAGTSASLEAFRAQLPP